MLTPGELPRPTWLQNRMGLIYRLPKYQTVDGDIIQSADNTIEFETRLPTSIPFFASRPSDELFCRASPGRGTFSNVRRNHFKWNTENAQQFFAARRLRGQDQGRSFDRAANCVSAWDHRPSGIPARMPWSRARPSRSWEERGLRDVPIL